MDNVQIISEIYGTARNSIKIYTCESELFNSKVILMSDLHNDTQLILDNLIYLHDISEYYVICIGDMAGDGTFGGDGDPTEYYEFILKHAKGLYYVQGNHDLPNKKILTNKDKSKCMIQNGKISYTPLGKIGGVNGIISNRSHPYKLPENEYLQFLNKYHGKNIDILLTHDTPKVSYIGQELILNSSLFIAPKVHIFGHCHYNDETMIKNINGTTFINVDARVIIIN